MDSEPPRLRIKPLFGDGDGDKIPDIELMEVRTLGIFAVWWDKRFDWESRANFILKTLYKVREDCIKNLGMSDPKNVRLGFYLNVYIHDSDLYYPGTTKKDDLFPDKWYAMVKDNRMGLPYMTLPWQDTDGDLVRHEGFHVFQNEWYRKRTKQWHELSWYIEASASWYAADRASQKESITSYERVHFITANPHLAIWHTEHNKKIDDPDEKELNQRQYALECYLFFLCEVCNVPKNIITDIFKIKDKVNPAEYLFRKIGSHNLREFFTYWAACNTDDFSYLSNAQKKFIDNQRWNSKKSVLNQLAFSWSSRNLKRGNSNENIIFHPTKELVPRGWSYNVLELKNDYGGKGKYEFKLEGDAFGSEGAPSYFSGRILIKKNWSAHRERRGVTKHIPFIMSGGIEGRASIIADRGDLIYVIITSVPEYFTSNQTYNYRLTFSKKEI
ncbi:MAG: hypothetical protein CMB08_05215 [Euryarchaeota archaeon]|nr:hypothetical protein [Euryarchaeota archaeon]